MTSEQGDRPVSVSRRELFILASISLATALLLGVVAEVGARTRWPEREGNKCYFHSDSGLFRPRGSCSARVKNAEGPWTTMSYNECGYRSPHSCGPKPLGTRRIVVMGTSIAEGLYVPFPEYFGNRLEQRLDRRCPFPVELQNVASIVQGAGQQLSILPEVLALRPDAVLLVLSPYDVLNFQSTTQEAAKRPLAFAKDRPKTEETGSLLSRLRLLSRDSRALLIAQHFMLQDRDFFVHAYQVGGEADALRVPLAPLVQDKYAQMGHELTLMGAEFATRGIPLLLVPVPNRIQAALISARSELPGVDAWSFSREMRALAERAHIGFVDTFSAFANTPNAERLYYAVDGHLTAKANAVLATAIEQPVIASSSSFQSCDGSR